MLITARSNVFYNVGVLVKVTDRHTERGVERFHRRSVQNKRYIRQICHKLATQAYGDPEHW